MPLRLHAGPNLADITICSDLHTLKFSDIVSKPTTVYVVQLHMTFDTPMSERGIGVANKLLQLQFARLRKLYILSGICSLSMQDAQLAED